MCMYISGYESRVSIEFQHTNTAIETNKVNEINE